MFALIITIIGIALAAAITAAFIYFGGDYSEESNRAIDHATVINVGGQIAGAMEIHKAETGDFPEGTSDEIRKALISKHYLTSVPEVDWKFENDFVVRENLTETTCLEINKKIGINSVPACTDETYANRTLCCATVL